MFLFFFVCSTVDVDADLCSMEHSTILPLVTRNINKYFTVNYTMYVELWRDGGMCSADRFRY